MYRMSYDGDYSRAWIGKTGYVIQQKMELSWEFDTIEFTYKSTNSETSTELGQYVSAQQTEPSVYIKDGITHNITEQQQSEIITLILSINPDITNTDYITNAGEIHE